MGTSVTAVVKHNEELIVDTLQDSRQVKVAADVVVHAAGRVPEGDDLGLEAAGVARRENGGVTVNQCLQSVSNPAVYAAGDA